MLQYQVWVSFVLGKSQKSQYCCPDCLLSVHNLPKNQHSLCYEHKTQIKACTQFDLDLITETENQTRKNTTTYTIIQAMKARKLKHAHL